MKLLNLFLVSLVVACVYFASYRVVAHMAKINFSVVLFSFYVQYFFEGQEGGGFSCCVQIQPVAVFFPIKWNGVYNLWQF